MTSEDVSVSRLRRLRRGQDTVEVLKEQEFSPGTYTNATVTVDAYGRIVNIKSGAGGPGAADLDGLADVEIATPATNQTLIFNGTNWVNAAPGTSFSFSVASFSDGQSSPQLIGLGVWKAAGALTFTASYSNGPATGASVQIVAGVGGWTPLSLAGTTGPTSSIADVFYPAVGATITFRVTAAKGAASATRDESVYFNNLTFWGVSTKASGFTEADVEGLANNRILSSNTRARPAGDPISVNAGANQYIIYAYPSRLGLATFFVGGFEGGFEAPETVSVTNTAGYVETYYVYRSTNANLGTTDVVVT